MVKELVIATGNAGKVREIGEIFTGMPLRLLTMSEVLDPVPVIEETGNTFAENARIKVDTVFSRSGRWSLGDDSGLAVDALDGAPGIRSARFAGNEADMEANKRKLLDVLSAVPAAKRTARFICAIALRMSNDLVIEAQGVCEGVIISAPRGSGGFGYDPLFIPEGCDRTFAELSAARKHHISHRGRALRKMKELLYGYLD